VLDAIADARRRGIAVMLVTAAASTIFVGSPASFPFVDASSPKTALGSTFPMAAQGDGKSAVPDFRRSM
jgi:hypothetical protein